MVRQREIQSPNDLLNFRFVSTPRPQEQMSGPGRGRGTRGGGRGCGGGRGRGRYNNHHGGNGGYHRSKEDRSSARKKAHSAMFYLHSSPDHAFVITRCPFKQQNQYSFQGPDTPVSWESVRMVKYFSSTLQEQEICPICLDVFTCARITKCGHVFCLPCLIHHMHVYQESHPYVVAPKCPCCALPIYLADVRPVTIFTVILPTISTTPSLPHQKIAAATRMTFTKLHRVKACAAPFLPGASHPRRASPFAAPTQTDDDAKFCKFNYVDPDVYQEHLRNNLMELTATLTKISSDTQTNMDALYSNLALDVVEKELAQADMGRSDELERKQQFENPVAGFYQSQPEFLQADYVLRGKKEDLDLIARTQMRNKKQQRQQQKKFRSRQRSRGDSFSSSSDGHCRGDESMRSIGSESELSKRNSCIEGERKGEEGEKHGHGYEFKGLGFVPCSMYQDGSTESEFYQAEDGTLCFLSSFNLKCLQLEFSSMRPTEGQLMQVKTLQQLRQLSPLPDQVAGRVVDIERIHLTPDIRERHRFLSHLPFFSDIMFVELDLDHFMSAATKKAMHEELVERRNLRSRRTLYERIADKKQKQLEEARIAALKERIQQIDPNDDFFRPPQPEPEPVLTGEEFGPSVSGDVLQSRLIQQPNATVSFSQVCQTTVTIPGMGLTRRDEEFPSLGDSAFPILGGPISLPAGQRPAPPPTWNIPTKASSKIVEQNNASNPLAQGSPGKKKSKGKKILLFSNGVPHHS